MLTQKQVERMFNAGFALQEINDMNKAKNPDGTPQNLSKVFNSKPFQQMLKSRREWWRLALKPKKRGGLGLTKQQGWDAIRNFYKVPKGAKKKSIFDFLKEAYRPPHRLSKKAFSNLMAIRSRMGKKLRKYGQPLRQAKRPVLPQRYTLGMEA